MTTHAADAAPWRSPRVMAWLGAELLSLVGDQIYFLAIAWAAIRAGGPSAAGLVLAAAAIPRGALMLLGGTIADRWGPRAVAVGSDAVRAVIMLTTAAVLLNITGPIVAILAVVAFTFGLVDALYYPASGALPPLIVETQHFLRLQNLRNIITRAALIIGAPLGGLILATGSVNLCFLINAITFLISAMVLACLKLRTPTGATDDGNETDEPNESFLRATVSGLRYAASRPDVRAMLLLVALFEVAFNGAVNIGLPALAVSRQWGSGGYGFMLGAIGVGASAAAVALLVKAPPTRVTTPLLVAAAGAGAASLAGLAAVQAQPLAVALGAGLGLAGGSIAGIAIPLVQAATEPAFLGRVMALFALATVGVAPLSLAAAGAMTALTGLKTTMYLAAAIVFAGGVVAGLWRAGQPVPVLRR